MTTPRNATIHPGAAPPRGELVTSSHLLVVTPDPLGDYPDDPEYLYEIECSEPAACHGWIECTQNHGGLGYPDDGDYERVIHGEAHTYRGIDGWTLDYPGCPAREAGLDGEDHYEIARTHGVGRHQIEISWDEFGVYLSDVR